MGSHHLGFKMLTHPTLVLSCLWVLSSGEECNTVEDPIKRDSGLGPWNVSRVERSSNGRNGKLVAVTDDGHSLPNAFYSGDSYVLQYSVREGRKPDVIYNWQGDESSRWEKGASAILTVDLDNKVGGAAKQARVEMNHEPEHFLNLFKGTFVTLLGGVERGARQQDTDGVMLFRVREECNSVKGGKTLVRTNQVPEVEASLSLQDAFILNTEKELYIWTPKDSSQQEKKTAAEVVKSLFPKNSAKVSSGDKPPKDFLAKLA